MDSVYLSFNSEIIKKFRDNKISSDIMGTTYLVLQALKTGNLRILDDLDDFSNDKRAHMLYRKLMRYGFITEASDQSVSYYELSAKGDAFLNLINESIDDEVIEPVIAAQATKPKSDFSDEWCIKYVEAFPKDKRCHPRIIHKRLEKFVENFPEYADPDLIYNAVKFYIKSATDNDNLQYIRESHYWLWKSENTHIIFDSATWCQKYLESKEEKKSELDTHFLDLA